MNQWLYVDQGVEGTSPVTVVLHRFLREEILTGVQSPMWRMVTHIAVHTRVACTRDQTVEVLLDVPRVVAPGSWSTFSDLARS